MNTKSIGSAIKGVNWWHLVFLVLASLSLSGFNASAQIVADFNDGNNTTTADGYTGAALGGWTHPWATTDLTNMTLTGTVTNTTPLNGGGNYLSLTSTATAAGQSYLYRSFATSGADSVSVTQPLQYTWDFSAASFNSATTYNFFDLTGTSAGGTGGNETWIIQILGTEIAYGAGNGSGGVSDVNTGLTATANDVYQFTVTSNPTNDTYTLTIHDLTSGSVYTSPTAVDYRYDATDTDGSILEYGTVTSAAVTDDWSLDSISISALAVPEPSSLFYLFVGGILLLGFVFKRGKNGALRTANPSSI